MFGIGGNGLCSTGGKLGLAGSWITSSSGGVGDAAGGCVIVEGGTF